MLMFLLKCLASTVIVLSSADLISQRNMTVCEKGTVNIVAANKPIPETYKRIEWLHNDSTILHIRIYNTSKFGGRISLWSNGTGLTIVQAKLEDQGTYKRFIILRHGGDNISEFILYVKELTTRIFNITILKSPSGGITLKCGESIGLNATYRWMPTSDAHIYNVFSKNADIKNKTSTGHELHLPSIPQKGSVYCQRHSDCTRSLTYSFYSGIKTCMHLSPCDRNDPAMRQDVSAGEVPKGGGIHIAAVVGPIVVIIITIIIIVVIVIILYKRRRERGRISRETGGGEAVSGVEEQML